MLGGHGVAIQAEARAQGYPKTPLTQQQPQIRPPAGYGKAVGHDPPGAVAALPSHKVG